MSDLCSIDRHSDLDSTAERACWHILHSSSLCQRKYHVICCTMRGTSDTTQNRTHQVDISIISKDDTEGSSQDEAAIRGAMTSVVINC